MDGRKKDGRERAPLTPRGKLLEDIDKLFHSHAAHDEVEAKDAIVHAIMGASGSQSATASVLDDKDPKGRGEQVWVESV